MSDESDRETVIWKLAEMITERPAIVTFGEGTGMIGAGKSDSSVTITFYDKNGDEIPKVIGAIVSSNEQPDEKANRERPVAMAVFQNRESLMVLKSIVDKGLSYFDEMDTDK